MRCEAGMLHADIAKTGRGIGPKGSTCEQVREADPSAIGQNCSATMDVRCRSEANCHRLVITGNKLAHL